LPSAALSAPNAPFAHRRRWWSLTASGREWFSLRNSHRPDGALELRTAALLLNRFIDAELTRRSLPPDACTIAGYSQGAMMALFAGLRRPIAPRAILSFAGALLEPAALATELRNRAKVLLIHGDDDPIVPPSASHSAAAILAEMGVPVELAILPGVDHRIDHDVIAAAIDRLRQPPC
jgi:phospholipase/carboxylesterase